MKKRHLLALALAGIAVAYVFWARPPRVDADLIISGGPILTLNADQPEAAALAISGGRIVAVGTLEEARRALPDAARFDLEGRALLPGLIEPHTHPIAAALLGAVTDVSAFTHRSRAEVIATLEAAAQGGGLTPWIVAYGWDPVALPDLNALTLEELDQISPEKPMIVLTQMMHEAYANSAALRAAGIPFEGEPERRHGVLRGEDGRPTGTLRELEAINEVMAVLPPPSDAAVELLVRRQYATYARAGYTQIGITGAVGRHPDPVGLLQRVAEETDFLRTTLYLLPEQMEKNPLETTGDLRIVGVKFWMDGSPFAGGAATHDPYAGSDLTHDRLGLPHSHMAGLSITPDAFLDEIRPLHAAGYQIAVHAQGERAIDAALKAFEVVQREVPRPELHHRLEHNALITPDQITRATAAGVSLGFFVDHVRFYGDALPKLFGSERTARYMPVRWAAEAGAVTAVHGDHPASPVDPLRTLRTAVERRSISGAVVGAEQALSVERALQAMTLDAAAQLGLAEEVGSLEVGKRADFTLLNRVPARGDLEGLRVEGTWREGQPVDTRAIRWLSPGLVVSTLMAYIGG